MAAILIESDSNNNRLLRELAEKLGAKVTSIDKSQYQDFLLGAKMDSEKTGETVSRKAIMKQLKGK